MDRTGPLPEGERIERAALEALHALADAALASDLGLALRKIGCGVASVAAALPASAIVINRTIGLGLAAPITREEVAEAAAAYRDAGVERFFVHVHPLAATPEAEEALVAAGLVPARGWQKFERGADAPLPPVEPIEIREVGAADAAAAARIICDCFDLGAAAEPWLARLPCSPGWRIFLATLDGEAAGTGGLFLRDGIGWIDFASTAPRFRRRGVQRALLVHRIKTAFASGCRRLQTCTGAAVPGDPQHSYANILRCGFRETYVRANWAPPKR